MAKPKIILIRAAAGNGPAKLETLTGGKFTRDNYSPEALEAEKEEGALLFKERGAPGVAGASQVDPGVNIVSLVPVGAVEDDGSTEGAAEAFEEMLSAKESQAKEEEGDSDE